MGQQSFFAQQTFNGHDLGEVVSALQKSIRRGLEEEALYWAAELDLSNFGEHCWKRLRVISSEDVGLAEPNIAANIHALYVTWSEFKKAKKPGAKLNPDRMFLTHAVLLLCRAKKSRIVDNAMNLFWKGHTEMQRDIPEWALDKHTLRGKRMGRSWDHFWDEGCKLVNESDLPDNYIERIKPILRSK
jgi:replication-associated recombination protein RarA